MDGENDGCEVVGRNVGELVGAEDEDLFVVSALEATSEDVGVLVIVVVGSGVCGCPRATTAGVSVAGSFVVILGVGAIDSCGCILLTEDAIADDVGTSVTRS